MTVSCPRRFRLVYASLASFVLLATLVILEHVVASDSGLIALLVYMPQHGFAILPLVLALRALAKRNFKCLAINVIALWLWVQWLLGWNVPLSRFYPLQNPAPDLRIMTYNVQRGERGVAGLMQTIRAQRPDILCLQETQDPPPRQFSFPGDVFQSTLKGWNSARGGDVMTTSRFPLVSQRLWPLSGGRRVLETVWQTPRGRVRVLNVHIYKSEAEKQLQTRNFATFALQLGANARIAAQTRLEQFPALQKAIGGEQTLPLVVAGDFNSPPRGQFHRALTARLNDAWAQGGWGTGATFPARWPLLGIDHIFLSRARATRAFVPQSSASDHLPLVADLVLDDPN